MESEEERFLSGFKFNSTHLLSMPNNKCKLAKSLFKYLRSIENDLSVSSLIAKSDL